MSQRNDSLDGDSLSFIMDQLCKKFNIITLKIKQTQNEKEMALNSYKSLKQDEEYKISNQKDVKNNLKGELNGIKEELLILMEDDGKSKEKAHIIHQYREEGKNIQIGIKVLENEKKIAVDQVEVLEIRNNYAKRDLDEKRGKRDEIVGLINELDRKKEEYEIQAIKEEQNMENMDQEATKVENQAHFELIKRSETEDHLRQRKLEYQKMLDKTIVFDKKVCEIDAVLAKEGHTLSTKKDRLGI